MRFLVLLLILTASLAVANNAYESVDAEDNTSSMLHAPGPVWDGPLAELYSNGPWYNSTGTGVGGADESILETPNSTLGFGFQHTAYGNIMADDFVIPSGQTWTIESITCFGYQTNSTTTPTFNGMWLEIWDDGPDSSPTLLWGDMTTNVYSSAAWTNVYRVSTASSGTSSARPIMAVTANLSTPVVLGEGDYWLHVNMDGTLTSGPWAPPISILGATSTGDAYQYTSSTGSWALALDSGGGTPQGIPFVLDGLPTALQRSTWGEIKSSF
jgi:hypothetical protein